MDGRQREGNAEGPEEDEREEGRAGGLIYRDYRL